VKALHSPEVENRIKAEGSEIGGITPEEFGRYIAGEIAKWKKVVADARISVE
jgi:tripartite-type tricarboxylate transporter receptor subunit TctC